MSETAVATTGKIQPRLKQKYRAEIVPLRELTPNVPITTNFMGTYPGLNYWAMAPDLDVVCWDNYPCWHGRESDWELGCRVSFVHDIYRRMKGVRPWMLMESTPSLTNWQEVSKLIEGAVRDLTAITGQKPMVTKARKSIAQFKLREGQAIGAHVTLRGDRAWEFLDRLISLALPRIRDFRGLSPKQFDGNGNYTFGLTEQSVFHEIDQDKIDRVRGFDITVVTTAKTDDEGRALLKALGFPFKAE